ncbi:hypothetical protein GS640_01945 [Rhodococcus hoagii]|nr:hypothetical protein [Prescottella equi]
MAQQQFHPRPPDTPKLDSERVEVQIPLTQPETTKPPLLQRILPFVMILAVGGFVVLMVSTSGSFNPYMMMMPLMLLVGVLGFLGGNGASNTDLNGERRNYFLGLREQRTIVHRQGEAMFKAQEMSFPQPSRLASLVGIDEHDAPSMWTVRAANPGGFITRSGTPDEKAFRPYLAARLGRGTVDLEPQIVTKELPVAEQLEPVTLGAYRKFLRTQRFVPRVPDRLLPRTCAIHSLIGDDDAPSRWCAR